MATTTPNFGWTVPTSTDLVKDGATAIETLGDAIDASLGGAWTSYTPTIKQGTTTLTTTITRAKYKQINKTVFLSVLATITSTGSAGTVISVTAPSGLAPLNGAVTFTNGTFVYVDAGAAFYVGSCVYDSGFSGIAHNLASLIGTAPSFTAANTDSVSITVTYEVA
jgi:hypothetical protein